MMVSGSFAILADEVTSNPSYLFGKGAGLLARQLLRAGALHTEAPRAHRVHCLCGAAVALRSNPN